MESRIIEIAETVLKMPKEEIIKYNKEIPEIDGYYFWNPVRGGLSVIVGNDGTKLGATSAVSFERHLNAYKSGKRN